MNVPCCNDVACYIRTDLCARRIFVDQLTANATTAALVAATTELPAATAVPAHAGFDQSIGSERGC